MDEYINFKRRAGYLCNAAFPVIVATLTKLHEGQQEFELQFYRLPGDRVNVAEGDPPSRKGQFKRHVSCRRDMIPTANDTLLTSSSDLSVRHNQPSAMYFGITKAQELEPDPREEKEGSSAWLEQQEQQWTKASVRAAEKGYCCPPSSSEKHNEERDNDNDLRFFQITLTAKRR